MSSRFVIKRLPPKLHVKGSPLNPIDGVNDNNQRITQSSFDSARLDPDQSGSWSPRRFFLNVSLVNRH